LTFEKVIADLSGAFASGQVYVALSRCTSFNGLVLKTQLHSGAIRTDPRVIEFAKNETPSTLIAEELNTGKADFYYKKAREKFTNGNILSAFAFFKKAIKYRNDIETETFQKFIEIQGKKLLSYKEKYLGVNNKLENIEDELLEEKERASIQNSELTEKENKLNEQNSAIELLLSKTEESENKCIQLKHQLKTTEEKLRESEFKVNGLETSLKNAEAKAEKYSRENELNKSEIKRIKNLKWYDKLFGKE
jgi:hypothetical protein